MLSLPLYPLESGRSHFPSLNPTMAMPPFWHLLHWPELGHSAPNFLGPVTLLGPPTTFSFVSSLFLAASLSSALQYRPEETNSHFRKCSNSDPFLCFWPHLFSLDAYHLSIPSQLGAMFMVFSLGCYTSASLLNGLQFTYYFFKIQTEPFLLYSWARRGRLLQTSFCLYSYGSLGIALLSGCGLSV